MFEHLDDPAPPQPPATGLVAARGLAIRNRRRYAAGGAVAAAGVALLLVTTLPGAPERRDELQVADGSPSPSASPEPTVAETASPSASPAASGASSPAAGPERTSRSVAPPPAPPGPDFAALTPPRAPQPPMPPCTAAQIEETHPAGSQPPAGVELTAAITGWTARTTSRGAYWSVELTIRNTTAAPVTFEDRGRAVGVYLDGRYVAGRPEGESAYPQPSGNARAVGAGQSVVLDVSISTWTCARNVLPYGRYDLSAGVRTDSGTWYAAEIPGWVGNAMMGGSDCFRYDDAPGRVPPVPGLELSVEGVPAQVPAPDSGFTARLVVRNTSARPVEFVDLEPGRRVAYLIRGHVKGGWTVGRDVAAATYVLAPGERRAFDVPVRGEACQTAEPIAGFAHDVMLGIATVRDGQPYLWTARGSRVTYPG